MQTAISHLKISIHFNHWLYNVNLQLIQWSVINLKKNLKNWTIQSLFKTKLKMFSTRGEIIYMTFLCRPQKAIDLDQWYFYNNIVIRSTLVAISFRVLSGQFQKIDAFHFRCNCTRGFLVVWSNLFVWKNIEETI